jgi:RNA polymerase sigma factor (sigma-70 family)
METLQSRERANYDVEDVLMECWLALRDRDDKYDPERGRYITFAGPVIEHHLYAIREKARVVRSPRNSSCRLNGYAQAEAEGKINARTAKTANDIRRTAREPGGIVGDEYLPCSANVQAEAIERELRALGRDAIIEALDVLTLDECRLIGGVFGLWDGQVRTVTQIAAEAGLDADRLYRVKRSAMAKLRAYLGATVLDDE